MRISITGGTGFVGREVVRQLRAAGHEPALLTRADISAGPNALAGRMGGCDALIHLVGIISEFGAQTFENVHVRLTETIIAAAHRAGLSRFIHMSALGTRPDARARYHQTKWAAEELVRGSGLAWTIFRPSIIYGPGDGFVNWLARIAARSPAVPLIGGGRTRFQPITVENVARCFVAALNEPASIGRTFDLGGSEILTLREMVATILQVTHRRRWLVSLPFAVATVQAALAELVFAKLLRRAPPLNRDQVVMLREDNFGDATHAIATFRLQSEPFRTGISKYLEAGRRAD